MFEKCNPSNRQKWLLRSAFQQGFWQTSSWFSPKTGKRFSLEVSKPTERAQVFLKKGTRNFQNSPLFKRCFYLTITGIFKHFQHFKFEMNFLKNANPF